ncbi:MAG: hypothetical protein J6C93_05080 [Clostridia bacterium]|nr:hypothetical protein [Clostridia bacterium]
MSNAIEFISAYNVIDTRLRSFYNGKSKGTIGFSDLVRRCAEHSATVRRYEDELLSFARLRNAIVHNSTKEQIIAEPNDKVTAQIKHIAELLSMPPKLKGLKQKKIAFLQAQSTLKEAVLTVCKSGYSNLPVYRGNQMLGVLNNRCIVRAIGEAIERNLPLGDFLDEPCTVALREYDAIRYYKILGEDEPIQSALNAFEENKKLLAVIVVRDGGEIVNLVTAADLPELVSILEE